MFQTITFTRYTPTRDGPWFDARSAYVERTGTVHVFDRCECSLGAL